MKKASKAKKATKSVKAKKAAPKKAAAKIAKPAPAKPVALQPKTRQATRPKNSNSLSYTMGEFLENVKGFCGMQKRTQAKEMVEDLSLFIKDALKKGFKIPLMGLGKLYVRESKARQGRNPQTGAVVQIPARKRVRFTAAKTLKEAVL